MELLCSFYKNAYFPSKYLSSSFWIKSLINIEFILAFLIQLSKSNTKIMFMYKHFEVVGGQKIIHVSAIFSRVNQHITMRHHPVDNLSASSLVLMYAKLMLGVTHGHRGGEGGSPWLEALFLHPLTTLFYTPYVVTPPLHPPSGN